MHSFWCDTETQAFLFPASVPLRGWSDSETNPGASTEAQWLSTIDYLSRDRRSMQKASV